MAVLRYFHQDPRQTSVQESSVIDKQGTVLTQKLTTINQSITNNTQVLEDKLNSVPGKSLSTNDFTDEYKNKLRGIEEGAEVNVQSDWGEDDNTADSYIKNKPVIDNIVTQNSENLITSGAVFTAIDELPEPMIFKGSLGVGGTIQTLPAPSADNVGFVYKVITAGTYYGITAKPGDSFISDGSDWILIPSGDEPEGTVMSVGLTVPTGLLVSGSPITTSGTLAITYALGYAIPTTAKLDEWDAKQNAISDLSTIRTNASNGNTAYGWGNHANAGYLAAISDLATIRSNASEGHTAYGWGNHANAGYVKSSGVTSVAMTVPTGLSISGSPITSTGTLALSFANGYSIPTTAKLSNWDTAYGWGNHANAGYLTQHLSLAGYLPLSGGTMTGNISFSNSGTGFRGINYGTMGDNDQWRIGGAATGSNAGYMEIATADDGNEPIYVRLYTGVFTTLKRTLTLLDASGNTIIPGSLYMDGGTNNVLSWADPGHPIICFRNGDLSLLVGIGFTDYDSYRSPAGLKVFGNQGGEWFEAAGEMYANGGNKVLHAGNSSVSLSGSTLTVKINGTEKSLTNTNTTYSAGSGLSLSGTTFSLALTKALVTTALGYTPPTTDTNTWRGILNNLTSDSTTDSLSAAQGKALANGSARDSTKLPLAGGTMTGNISFSNNTGISAIMGGGTDNWGIIGTGTGDAGRLKIYVGDNGVSDWMDFEFRDYTGTTYTPLSMTGNSVQFTVNPTVNGNSIWHAGNLTNLNLLTNGPGYITSSSLGSYLPLTGGTLSNGNWGLQLTLKRQGGTPSLYFNDGTYSYYFYPTMSKDNEWHVGLTYNNKDYTLWHNGNFNPANYLPLTGGTLSGDLNVRNSKIWIQSNSEAGSNSNRLTTSAGMPGNMQYNTSRRGTQIYSNGIAFADPYNGNSNNDAAWIRHLETTGNAGLLEIAVGDDASNEEIRFRRYNTSNNIASDVLVPNTTGTLALTSQIPTNLNQLTNGPGYITGITKTMVTNALGYTPPTADTNTWRGITDSYSGTDSSISLSQKGGKALYDALVNGLAGTVYQTYSNGSSNYRVLLGYPDSNNGYKNVYKNNFFYANPNVKKVYIDGSLYFTNTGNSSGGWNIYSQGVGLRILDDTGSSDRGAPSNYYATGLHVGGQYWFLLAFERGDNRLLYRGGNAEGVTRDWTRIPIYGDDEYACRGKMWIQCDTYDSSVIIGALEKEDTTQGPFVGIGKVDPSYKLHVNGACGATSHPTTSDIRIKDIQSDISINLEDIANAPLFLFKWKEGGDNLTHVGTSALYWKEKVPELVSEANDERKTLSLEYEVLGTAGSIAIAKEVVSLKEEIKLLQALIAELKLLLNN